MATTPATSISSSYQRIGGSTPVITQGTPGPQLSAATKQRLSLADKRKLEEEQELAEGRRLSNLMKTNVPAFLKEQAGGMISRVGGTEAYKKYMNEMGGDPNKPVKLATKPYYGY